ncbi:DUF6204 family protein [Streptomyces sp. NPDC001700]
MTVFRVTMRGVFEGLAEEDRAALLAEVDAFRTAYTEEGTFTYDRGLSAFTFRCQVPVESEADGEAEAAERAGAALVAHGYPHRILRVGVTDMRAIKIRRKGRGR